MRLEKATQAQHERFWALLARSVCIVSTNTVHITLGKLLAAPVIASNRSRCRHGLHRWAGSSAIEETKDRISSGHGLGIL